MNERVQLPSPSLIWQGEASREALGFYDRSLYGQWRIVAGYHYGRDAYDRIDESQPIVHLRLERSTAVDALGVPVWNEVDAFPAGVVQAVLQSTFPIRSWQTEVSEALANAESAA